MITLSLPGGQLVLWLVLLLAWALAVAVCCDSTAPGWLCRLRETPLPPCPGLSLGHFLHARTDRQDKAAAAPEGGSRTVDAELCYRNDRKGNR